MTTGPDLSHYQGSPNFAQVKAAGHAFVVLKATESTNFLDPMFAGNRKAAHAAGLVVGIYHFARAGNAAAEAAYFVRTVGALQPGEFLVLDQEVPNTIGWCRTWLDAVYAATGVRPLIYMNQSASTGLALGDWSTVAESYGLWLAKYDGTTAFPSVPHWGTPAMKQYSDKGSVPGVSGPCDVNVFNGTREQLLAYGAGGTQEDDMTPDQANQLQQLYDAMFKGGASMPGGLPLPQATAYSVWWETSVTRADASGKKVQIPALQDMADAKTLLIAAQGQVAGLLDAIHQLTGGGSVDLAAVKAAAEAGAADALSKITITVNSPSGPTPSA